MNSEEVSTEKSAPVNCEKLSTQPSSSTSPDDGTSLPSFTPDKEELFQHRYEEGYDLYDPEYFSWLEVYHPEALPSNESSISEFFPDVPALSPVDGAIPTDAHHLNANISSGYQPSNNSSSSTSFSSTATSGTSSSSSSSPFTSSGYNSSSNENSL